MRTKNFWQVLKNKKKPILALAPMAGFSDSVFSSICEKNGADVLYSEMVSATALYYLSKEKNKKKGEQEMQKTLDLLSFKAKRGSYFVAQLFGPEPEHFAVATKIITEKIKPDGIDINFGCPVSKITKQGSGSALMKDLARSRAVIQAVLDNTHLPVSVKIRLESQGLDYREFLKNISDLDISALMIHARTLKQGFVGPADYRAVKEARKYFSGLIIVNGGINDLETAKRALKESQADGLALARGVLGRPWLFSEIKKDKVIKKRKESIYKMIIEHAQLSYAKKGKTNITELRKNLCWYLKGIEGASKLRAKLVQAKTLAELKEIFKI